MFLFRPLKTENVTFASCKKLIVKKLLEVQNMSSEWTEVKKKVKRTAVVRPEPCRQDQVLGMLESFFSPNPYVVSAVMYGSSTSATDFSKTSDVDVMAFVKTSDRLDFREWKEQLQQLLNRKVDLVIMRVTAEIQNPEYRDRVFYDQVYESGRHVCGDNFKDYLDRSKKVTKL